MSIGEIKNKLIKRSMGCWEKQLKVKCSCKHGKLRTYFCFKSNFMKENYRHVIKNRDVRKCFTQFRISAHQLAIERGRYKNIKADERFCKCCQAKEIEDEIHCLEKCQTSSNEREKLFSYIEKSCNNSSNLSEENKFIWLMTSEDIDTKVKLANHIFTCFSIRK